MYALIRDEKQIQFETEFNGTDRDRVGIGS
jgi:hypothetical protein